MKQPPGTAPVAFPEAAAALLPFAGGLIVALALIWAVWIGIRARRRAPAPPAPHEHPGLPPSGPVREVQEAREPDEVPLTEDHRARLTPHELKAHGNTSGRRSEDQRRRRWSRNSSGAFGSGGPGST
ncbi:DUF6479 family protein [Streptomyces sp. NPDC059002]|uniref:DUF6479 family protein n=1 Tax=Streptomyces sp. NPDC059002 TaxID=3346690 RepID=UPI0036757C0D